jgi:rare lipoprotein A
MPVGALPALCLCLVAAAMLAGACSRSERGGMERRSSAPASPRVVALGQPVPKGGGVYKVGEPYEIDGQWHTPREEPGYDRTGIASYYGTAFHGRRTSNGEIFDMGALSAAHPTLPMPSYVYVTNLRNGRTLRLRVNDRGPYANSRIIDLSQEAARSLGFERQGTVQVRVRYAGRAPLSGDDSRERRFLAGQSWSRLASFPAPGRQPIDLAGLPTR